jgi:hypothetical protein
MTDIIGLKLLFDQVSNRLHNDDCTLDKCYELLNKFNCDNKLIVELIEQLSEIQINETNLNNMFKRILIFQNDRVEMLLIIWGKNSKSLIHDHPKNGCLFKLLCGKLKEDIYKKDSDMNIILDNSKIINVNDIGYQIGTNGIHQIININDNSITDDNKFSYINDSGVIPLCGVSISLHFYSPPKYIFKSVKLK